MFQGIYCVSSVLYQAVSFSRIIFSCSTSVVASSYEQTQCESEETNFFHFDTF